MTNALKPWMFRQCWFNTPLWCRLDVLVRLCSTRTFFVQNKLNIFKSKSKKNTSVKTWTCEASLLNGCQPSI